MLPEGVAEFYDLFYKNEIDINVDFTRESIVEKCKTLLEIMSISENQDWKNNQNWEKLKLLKGCLAMIK